MRYGHAARIYFAVKDSIVRQSIERYNLNTVTVANRWDEKVDPITLKTP